MKDYHNRNKLPHKKKVKKEKYFVYKLVNQFEEIIYIGYTGNPEQREKQHQKGIQYNTKKSLYNISRENGYIITLEIINSFISKKEAELFEIYSILNERFNNNKKLLNKVIEKKFL